MLQNNDKAQGSCENKLAVTSQVRLSFASTYYTMAQALGIQKLQDFIRGSPSLTTSHAPIWLLGVKYETTAPGQDGPDQSVLDSVTEDFQSIIWMSYRKAFAPLGSSELTTDAGWGCTLRSGQMLLAQGLQQHCVGRAWRRHPDTRLPEALSRLLRWFWDDPSPQYPFSIHNLCAAGRPHGVKAGEWLGPWVLCHTLEAVMKKMEPASLNVHVHVVSQPGGAVPVLYTASFKAFFKAPDTGEESAGGSGSAEGRRPQPAVIVLLPLLLGLGKVNERYIPQLQRVLTWPQSIGIVGGRPSSSLYFVGCQDDQVIYLDPHQAQQTQEQAGDSSTYWGQTIRMMPLANIDPSLAIAFYCRTLDDGMDLLQRLSQLEAQSKGAPLVSIIEGHTAPDWQESHDPQSGEEEAAGDWEML
ncbi:hypothetical protein ABBQ38_008324 [Trebouxia sp. C0009 RCD-2024]